MSFFINSFGQLVQTGGSVCQPSCVPACRPATVTVFTTPVCQPATIVATPICQPVSVPVCQPTCIPLCVCPCPTPTTSRSQLSTTVSAPTTAVRSVGANTPIVGIPPNSPIIPPGNPVTPVTGQTISNVTGSCITFNPTTQLYNILCTGNYTVGGSATVTNVSPTANAAGQNYIFAYRVVHPGTASQRYIEIARAEVPTNAMGGNTVVTLPTSYANLNAGDAVLFAVANATNVTDQTVANGNFFIIKNN